MSPQCLLPPWLKAAPLLAALGWPGGLFAQASGGAIAGAVPGSNGTAAGQFGFQSSPPPRVTWPEAPVVVPLPVGFQAEALGDNGVVLLSSGGNRYRWIKGQLQRLELPFAFVAFTSEMNRQGEVWVRYDYDSITLHDALFTLQGVLKPLDLGPYYGEGYLSGLSNGYGVGRVLVEAHLEPRDDVDGGVVRIQSWASAKWNLATGTFQELGGRGERAQRTPVEPLAVNDQGDYLSWHWRFAPGNFGVPGELLGYFLNEQELDFPPSALNNRQAVVGYDPATGVPVYQQGTRRHVLGDLPGYPVSINDEDEILVDQDDGRSVLWQGKMDASGVESFDDTDLAELTGLDVFNTVKINNAGEILFAAFDADFAVQPYLLTSERLGVDFNRDGIIDPSRAADNPDRELARRQLPWYFWVNDDDDSGETDGTDIPGKGVNAQDNVVNGVRDLVDFFPVQLDIAGLLSAYPAADAAITYKLAQADGAANFLTTELTPATAGAYQRNAEVAKILGGATVTPITAGGVALDRAFLGKILPEGKGIILVEARKATTAPLRLEVWRGSERVGKVELPLSFASVESMFRHRNLTGAVNITPETQDRGVAPNWPDELNNGQALVFLHGYNVNQQQARGWQAEFFKRQWWSGSRAQFWGVTWYGNDSQLRVGQNAFTPNYHLNVIHAFGTAPRLADFIRELRQPETGLTEVNVASHSLGNIVASSAITDHQAPVNRYFMIDAAVAAEAYDGGQDSQVVQPDDSTAFLPHTEWNKDSGGVYPPKLWPTNWHSLFPSGDARSRLTWRDRFAPPAGTAYYNFHSTGEEVLGYDSKSTPSLVGVLATEVKTFLHITRPEQEGQPNGYKTWVYQEQLKGRTITGAVLGSNYGGWGFNALFFKKRTGGYGKGPVLSSAVLTPAEASNAVSTVFTDQVLREEPFFRPGGFWTKLGSWLPGSGGAQTLTYEPIGPLYDSVNGSAFAARHRDSLLARMIPAMSPAAGRIPVLKLGDIGSQNFDMSSAAIRGTAEPWPTSPVRNDKKWRHSDLRAVAYPYVRGLYDKLVQLGRLGYDIP